MTVDKNNGDGDTSLHVHSFVCAVCHVMLQLQARDKHTDLQLQARDKHTDLHKHTDLRPLDDGPSFAFVRQPSRLRF